MEISASFRAINHACFAVENTALLIYSLSSVPVELGRELDLGFDLLSFIVESTFGQLHAKLILSGIVSFVLVLHIRMHISIEKCIIISIFKEKPDTLIRGSTILY